MKMRHELKFYISNSDYLTLSNRLSAILPLDKNAQKEGSYSIRSLYFDDAEQTALDEKLLGAQMRKKYRIRIYDGSSDLIRLECKLKKDSMTAKESAIISLSQYKAMEKGDLNWMFDRSDNPIFKEYYLSNALKHLMPAVVVDYNRVPYIAQEGNVRITFDLDLRANINTPGLYDDRMVTTQVMPEGMQILEVKYDAFLPSYIKNIIQLDRLEQCTISKFVLCRQRLLNYRGYEYDMW